MPAVLDTSQRELCRKFSARDEDRFADLEVATGLHGLPLLTRYHARFECESFARHDAGDHTLIIGRVLRLAEQEGELLIFYRGGFSGIDLAS